MGPVPQPRRPATSTGASPRNPQQPIPPRPTLPAGNPSSTPSVRLTSAPRPTPIIHNLHRPRVGLRTQLSPGSSRPHSGRPSQSNSMTSSLGGLDDAPSYSLRTDLPFTITANNAIAASIISSPPNPVPRSTALSDNRARLIRQVQAARRKPPTSLAAENVARRNRQSLSAIRRRISQAIPTETSNASSDAPLTTTPTLQIPSGLTSVRPASSRPRSSDRRSSTLRSYIPFSRNQSSPSRSRSPRRTSNSSGASRRINRRIIDESKTIIANMSNIDPVERVMNNEKVLLA